MSAENIILVDDDDNVVGFGEKLAVHQNGGRLHRAFSILIYNPAGQMLLQRRAETKYHFGGRWTNACCGHPQRGEELQEAVHRRIRFELGFDTDLAEVLSFIYKAEDPQSGLVEHEYDHVFVGTYDGDPEPNPAEVDLIKWVAVPELRTDMNCNPTKYTPWFHIVMDRLADH